MKRPLAGLLGAVGSLRVDRLDDQRFDFRRVQAGRDAVVEERGRIVEAGAPLLRGLEDVLLHERLAEAHVDRALHLALHQHRVQGAPAVVRHPDPDHVHHARLDIHLHFRDVRRERVRGGGADGPAPVVAVIVARGVVPPRGPQRAEARLGQVERPGDRHPAAGVGREVRPAARQPHLARPALPGFGHRLLHLAPQLAGRVDAGVAQHEGDARRIGAQVHRGEIGVAGEHADVLERHAQLLGGDVGHHGVAALPDLRGPAQHRHASRPVHLQLDRRLRHLVGVDRIVGPGDVAGTRHPEPPPRRQPPEPLPPAARLLHGVQALQEAVRGDAQLVHRARVAPHEVGAPELDGVLAEPLGQLVQLHLEGEARLHRAMAAFRAARRFVGVDARGVEAIRGHGVGSGEQLAGVVGGHQPERRVGAPVQHHLGVHRLQPPLRIGAGPVLHVEGMPAAMGVEHLFAGVENLYRATRHHGQAGDAEFEVEGLRLAAERPAHRGLNHADGGGIQPQNRGELAVQVMGHLGGGPHRQAPALVVAADGAVRLDGRVGRPLEEVVALHDHLRGRHALVHLAEAEPHPLGDVPVPSLPAGLVDERPFLASIRRERRRRIQVGGQLLVLDPNPRQRPVRGVLVHRRHRRHAVADVAHPLHAQRILVGRPGNDAVADRHVPARDDGAHALERQRPGGVDGDDAGVRVDAPQDLAVQHAREREIVGVGGLAGRLRQPLHLALWPSDQREAGPGRRVRVGRGVGFRPQGQFLDGAVPLRGAGHSPFSSRSLAAAASMAS